MPLKPLRPPLESFWVQMQKDVFMAKLCAPFQECREVLQSYRWMLGCPQSYANIVSVCLDVRLAVGTCNTSNNECLDAVKGMKLCFTMPWPSSYDPVYGQDMTCIWIKAYCSSRRKKQRRLLPLVAECGGNFLLCCVVCTRPGPSEQILNTSGKWVVVG